MSTPFEIPVLSPAPARNPLSRWAVFTAPALLVCGALSQLALTHAGPLNPAKGGGFGLFSTVDKLENRILLASLETPTGDLAIGVIGLDADVQDALSFPSQRKLDRLAHLLMSARTPPAGVTGLRLEVWKRSFDPATGAHRRILVAKRAVPFES